MRRAFIAFIRWYLTLKPWERSGRIYEWMGIPWIDAKLSKVFGESPLVRYAPGDSLSREYLQGKMLRGQYSEVVNAMCFLIYVGLMVICWLAGHWGLGAWSALIAFTHWIVMPIERYKRALSEEWMRTEGALTDEPFIDESLYLRSEPQLRHWYFEPKPWESEKLYDRVGVHSFRLFVFWLTQLAETIASDDAKQFSPNQLKQSGAEQLDKFERDTRTSETVHLIGVLQHLPFAIVFLNKLYWPGIFYLLGMAYLNVYAILLQRHHRTRLFKVLLRRAQRAQKSG